MATSTLYVCSLHKVSSFAPPYFCNDVASPSVGAVFIEDLLLSQYRLHFPQSAMMNQILMMGMISLVLLKNLNGIDSPTTNSGGATSRK